jgi:hypothetical protein
VKPRISKIRRQAIEATLKAMAEHAPITPERVVEAAAAEDSPLHACFEWDDAKAAAAYRLDQARALIRSVEWVTVIEERQVQVPYFVRDPSKDRDQQGYVTLDQLRTNPAQAKQHLQAELKAVLALLKRAEGYAEVLQMTADLEQVRAGVRRLSARIDGQPLQ